MSLCVPDHEKSCFACCPPIRPSGYEHVRYKGMIKRVLRENTRAYRPEDRSVRPITGFSCWALGYLDPDCRLVGCLLHPGRNRGKDLRFRVDYGEKCRREICPEAAVFDLLDRADRAFWLGLVDGLDAFSYSSRSRNPLFHLLNWRPGVLCAIAEEARASVHTVEALLEGFPFLRTRLSPRGWAYPVRRLIAFQGTGPLRSPRASGRLERRLLDLLERIEPRPAAPPESDGVPTHRLPLDRTFLDFLRLSGGVRRITPQEALSLKDRVDEELERMARAPTHRYPTRPLT